MNSYKTQERLNSLVVAAGLVITAAEHVHSGGSLLFLLGFGLGSSGGGTTGSGGRGSEGIGVVEHLLDLLELLEDVVGSKTDGSEDLEGTAERVGNSGSVDLADLEGDGSQAGSGGAETSAELNVSEVEDLGSVQGTVLVYVVHHDTELEGADVELGQEGNGGGGDLLSSGTDVDIAGDLDSTTGNLGGDVQGLEERGLSRVKAGRTGRDGHIDGSEDAGLGSSGLLELSDDVAETLEVVLVGEDKTNVTLDKRKEILEAGVLGDVFTDDLAHDGVLAHQDHGLATEGNANALHLLGTDEVDADDEDVLVLSKSILELGPVVVLADLSLRELLGLSGDDDFTHGVLRCGDSNFVVNNLFNHTYSDAEISIDIIN